MTRSSRWPHALVVALAAAPLLALGGRAMLSGLGANPIEEITHTTGAWSLRLLLLTLAVTPVRRWLGLPALAPLRRSLGLATFAMVCLHLLTYLLLDQTLDWQAIVEDVGERRYITMGLAGFACLLPLALTSTRGWMRRLGRRWVSLHRLVYVAALCGIVHYTWLVKADLAGPVAHASVLAALLLLRLRHPPQSWLRRIRSRRRHGPVCDGSSPARPCP
jgi:sulfoxide reductase heme-binding subunit YedZ